MIFLLFVFMAVLYLLLLLWIIRPVPALNSITGGQKLRFSVVIAARNEEKNIRNCLDSLLQQNYSPDLYEIIVVDDHSTDRTAEEIKLVSGVRYLKPEAAEGKKAALTCGIMAAQNQYIVVTDADCLPGKNWLMAIDRLFRTSGADLITGPVAVKLNNTALAAFEAMDAAMMMAVTARGIQKNVYHLSNGANMAFLKDTFLDLQGFSGNHQFASGDDVFLFRDAAKKGKKIAYLNDKDALVYTLPQADFKSLLAQRKRWATKTRAYAGPGLFYIQALVAATHFCVLAGLLLAFVEPNLWKGALFLLAAKWVVDYFALKKTTTWQSNEKSMQFFIAGQFIYMVIILYSAIVVFFPRQYEWKARKTQ